ncbi:N-acetylglucosamine-1-phosphotransferase subunit gamma-like [Mercenaria mercenaria]|uniref:N-acetylglucosamine-1-phosphotransferase subunit gamma-like n=1 Tax=Mercenaria mercenaria TaxID=6596 RepID=UPI00234EF07E|nr:N-acetylglucosamine-1-phosphotransferase subunit gamma-like [Mercenaria mercenaria]
MAGLSEFPRSVIFCFMFLCTAYGERHSIKIVEEPSTYGIMNSYHGGNVVDNASKLKMRVKPSNFSGPALFRRLTGKCFTMTDDSYKYEFCPFSNVTQHEQSLRWNPYSGILGVWQEWEIENNTFVAMVMREGDKCGNSQRTMKVFFFCDKENKVLNVSEPSTCNYHMNFSTPYVCHRQAMLVYPTLDKQLQTEWGLLEGELQRGEVTKKGYKKYLSRIFVKAGYMLSEDTRIQISQDAVQKEKTAKEKEEKTFTDVYTCREEYQKLEAEVQNLRDLLAEKENNERAYDHHGMGDDYIHMND